MSKKIVLEVVVGLILLALLVVGVVGFQFYRAPLAEPLSIVQAASATPDSSKAQSAPTAAAPAEASQKLCGISGDMTVLMIGRDEHTWEPPFGADAIRLVKVNFDQKTVKIFAFQRDLLLATPGLEKKYGVKEYRLGEAYTLVRDKEGKQTPGADIKATNALAQILYDNFGIVPDHYLTIEETVLPTVIDTIGKVKVNVKKAIDAGDLKVKTGEQVMNGKTAMLYSRYLENGFASEYEWDRMERQASVFRAMAVRMLDTETYTKIPDLYKQVNKTVVTDLSPEQIKNLACAAKEISLEQAVLKTIEKNQVNILPDESMVIKNMDDIKQVLNDLFGS